MKKLILLSGLSLVFVLGACTDKDEPKETANNDEQQKAEPASSLTDDEVNMTMYNRDKEDIGTAVIKSEGNGVRISLHASDLPPGTHGFHIHEGGVCEPTDFKSAGGHFNPTNAKHGFDHPEGPHAGDLQNITVNQNGKVIASVTADMVTLKKGKENSLFKEGGTTLIIHANADDFKSQPAGDAGKRIACGVVSE
ncbi:superoxide dismutase family protein [Lentibacillus cibarius]|uniref:Superoxide dismutase [Cu-Zn] n=1 Tax=Lentibacillus cibarius TaxID=2583219 RepID=A0A549YG72_9BACI|nr:superoxide dismutase family protein [Lentibacillus cibarius]TMN22111.1 superoxide dismutase family protein [Lentibacillus cibarius]TRM10884.1 superoxide dismutase family protein [Lentibacillus cibarius]